MPVTLDRVDDATLSLSINGVSGTDFQKTVSVVKSVPGRRFDGDTKTWNVPATVMNANRLLAGCKAEATIEVETWLSEERKRVQGEVVSPIGEDAELSVPWADRMYSYQRAGAAFMSDHRNVLLADEQGLGKTVQAISAVAESRGIGEDKPLPVLVVCPNSVKGVWARELFEWAGIVPTVIKGNAEQRDKAALAAHAAGRWAIVNWEALRLMPGLALLKYYAVIADEIHRAKNRKAQQAKALHALKADLRFGLSGTPVMNSPDELWSQLAFVRPDRYGRSGKAGRRAYWSFYDDYVDYYEGPFGKVIVGVRNPDALRFELRDVLVRRTKDDVLDLPPRSWQTIPLELLPAQRRLYTKVRDQMFVDLERDIEAGDVDARQLERFITTGDVLSLPNAAARTVRLRQVASTPALFGEADKSAKLDAAVELIEDRGPEAQTVVFAEFKGTIEALGQRLAKRKITFRTLTGDVPEAHRTQNVSEFQAGEARVFLATLSAGGVGITLTAADTAIFIERSWVPANNDQALDRLHRIGQERSVTGLVLEAEDTIDDGSIEPTNRLKRLISDAILSNDNGGPA